ncbi:hypothetical protein [Nocardia tengchongensis]|uniref:hypothetical protein n=1 Tax=Nocardia tengchongensis TaxID=2055889 RepID=UPI0036522681
MKPKAIVLLVGGLAAAAGVWVLTRPAAPETTPAAHPPAAASSTPAAPTKSSASAPTLTECRQDHGDQSSGAGVIAAFQWAYYHDRSAVAARALATPTSTVQPPEVLQGYIDQVPVGTDYCLRVGQISDGVYLTVLSEKRKDQPSTDYTQTVTTVKVGDRWFIDAFK